METNNWNLEMPNLERPTITEDHTAWDAARWIVDIGEIVLSFILPETIPAQVSLALTAATLRSAISAEEGTLSPSEAAFDYGFALIPAGSIIRKSKKSINILNNLSVKELETAFPEKYAQTVLKLGREMEEADYKVLLKTIEKSYGGAPEANRFISQSIYNLLWKTNENTKLARTFAEAFEEAGLELSKFKEIVKRPITRAMNYNSIKEANKIIKKIGKDTGYGTQIISQIVKKELGLSARSTNVNGLFTWFPARPYHTLVQAIHFLDPKLAARKTLTIGYRKITKKLGLGQHGLISIITKKLMHVNVFAWYEKFLITRHKNVIPLNAKMGFTLAYRAIPMDGYGGVFTVILYFNPMNTRTKSMPHGKEPSYLYPMDSSDIKELEKRTGAYYLDIWAASRGGKSIGGFGNPITAKLFGSFKYSVLQDTWSLIHHLKKDSLEMYEGTWASNWIENYKLTTERLLPHKIGKFFAGRYGTAIARGFQHKQTLKNGLVKTTIFTRDKDGKMFNPYPLYTSISRGTRQYARRYESTYSKQRRRNARYTRQLLRARQVFSVPSEDAMK